MTAGLANPVAENVFGTIGAVLWSTQMIPQIMKSYRQRDTHGLSTSMLVIWFSGSVFLGAYCITRNLALPLLVQPQCFCFFCVICYAQCLYYDQNKSRLYATAVSGLVLLAAGALELALVYGARVLESQGHSQATSAWGILSEVSILVGFVPQFVAISRLHAVLGISLIFLCVDMAGAASSALALCFASGPFDWLAALSYGSAFVIELAILVLAALLNPRYARRQEQQQAETAALLAGVSNVSRAYGLADVI